jgi:hypothetical protein
MKVFKLSSDFVVNYDNLYVFTQDERNIVMYGDMQCVFDDSEIEEVCQRLRLYDGIFDKLTKEDLLEMLEKIKKENKNERME